MKWLGILLILTTTNSLFADADTDVLSYEGGDLQVRFDGRKVYTERCERPASCFKLPLKLSLKPNQSPLFSVCLQSGGTPYFAKMKKKNEKLEFCVNSEKQGVELNMLMEAYKLNKVENGGRSKD